MRDKIDPKLYGLTARTMLERDGSKFVFIVDRKSRFIMKDAKALLEKSEKILDKEKGARIVLELSAPLCSKSRSFLVENSIGIIEK